jgi:hypothetical protein
MILKAKECIAKLSAAFAVKKTAGRFPRFATKARGHEVTQSSRLPLCAFVSTTLLHLTFSVLRFYIFVQQTIQRNF